MTAVKFSFCLTAKRISTQNSVTADALSRFIDLDMASTAHLMLEVLCGIDIASPEYDLFDHMSHSAFELVLQNWMSNGIC